MSFGDEDGLTFLATSYHPHNRLRLDKHLHGYHTMQLMTTGGVELFYDDDRYLLTGGAWFWPAFPGPRLRFHPAPGYDSWFHRHVGFTGPLVARWKGMGIWPEKPQAAPPGRDWGAFFDELRTLSRRADRMGRLRGVNLLEQMLLELAEARTQDTGAGGVRTDSDKAWLSPLLEKLETADAFAPNYTLIAADLGMSLSTLRRRFRRAMGGATLHEWVIENRIARARTLLSETDLPLKAVAERLGYDSVYFFARQFKAVVQASPGVFRRSRQG